MDTDGMTDEEKRIADLAYRLQILRCWIINNILSGGSLDDVRESAKKALRDTEF